MQLAPPLISGQKEFDAIYEILHGVLGEASLEALQTLMSEQAADRSGPVAATTGRPAAGLRAGRRSRSFPFRATHPRTSWSTPTAQIWTGVDDGRIVRISPDER